MRYRVSADAERDLGEIFLYWATRASLEAADRVVDRITERFWLLGEHPDAGKPAGSFAAGVKCFPAGRYLIYYRKTRQGTDILHIFHGARNQWSVFKTARKRRQALPGMSE
jgi:toxin ParE1/3/4